MTGFGLNKWLLKVFKNMSNNRRKSDNSFINSFLGKSLFVAFSMGFRILEVKGLDFFTQAAGYHSKVHAYFTRAVIDDMKLPDMSYFSNQ